MDAGIPENLVAQLSGRKNLKSLDSYKSASTAHQRKMSLVLSRSTVTASPFVSETNQANKVFKNSLKQNLPYSNSSVVEGILSGARIQRIEGCNVNFYFNATKTPIRGSNIAKKDVLL